MVKLGGIREVYGDQLKTLEKAHNKNSADTESKINLVLSGEKEEILRELQLEEGEEFKAMLAYGIDEKACQTDTFAHAFTVSVQFAQPKKKVYSKAVQVNPPMKMDRITQTHYQTETVARNSLRSTHLNELETPQINRMRRRSSINLDTCQAKAQNIVAEDAEILEIVDDEGGDDIKNMLELIEDDQPENSLLNEQVSNRNTENLSLTQYRKSPSTLLSEPKSPRGGLGGVESSQNIEVRQPSLMATSSAIKEKETGKLIRLPSAFFEDKAGVKGPKSISLNRLKEVVVYFDEALATKSIDDLTKDKESLKIVIKKLDDFIEFNKRNLSKLDKAAFESKERILEQVQTRIIEFSDIQTKYYQTIFEKEADIRKRSMAGGEVIEPIATQILRDTSTHRLNIRVEVIKKIKSMNNQMISEANNILKKILMKKNRQEIRKDNTVSRRGANLLPFITKIYSEYTSLALKAKNESKGFPSVPLQVFSYRFISLNFSTNGLVQKKYEGVLSCIISNNEASGISLFGRFLGITGNFDHQCFEVFVEMLLRLKQIM